MSNQIFLLLSVFTLLSVLSVAAGANGIDENNIDMPSHESIIKVAQFGGLTEVIEQTLGSEACTLSQLVSDSTQECSCNNKLNVLEDALSPCLDLPCEQVVTNKVLHCTENFNILKKVATGTCAQNVGDTNSALNKKIRHKIDQCLKPSALPDSCLPAEAAVGVSTSAQQSSQEPDKWYDDIDNFSPQGQEALEQIALVIDGMRAGQYFFGLLDFLPFVGSSKVVSAKLVIKYLSPQAVVANNLESPFLGLEIEKRNLLKAITFRLAADSDIPHREQRFWKVLHHNTSVIETGDLRCLE